LLAALVIFGGLVYVAMSRSLRSAVDDALRLNVSHALTVIEVEEGRLDLPDNLVQPGGPTELTTRDFVVRILGPDGRRMRVFGPYGRVAVPEVTVTWARQGRDSFVTQEVEATDEDLRLYTAPIVVNNRLVGIYQVGQTLTGVESTLQRLLFALLVAIPIIVVAAGLGGHLLASRALAPIDEMTRTAGHISAQDLSARLQAPGSDDEVGRLARTFNAMLSRLEEAFRRERQFTADASHELRTPLAGIQTILQVTRGQRRSPEAYERALDDLGQEANRLQMLIEKLLLLARTDGEPQQPEARVDLSLLLADTLDSMRSLAEAKGLTLDGELSEGLCVLGDRDSLVRLFANLIDNALKYTPQGGIRVQAQAGGDGRATVAVADTGIGIAPEHHDRIFERFYRVDASRTSRGAGLGLSIAQEIARAHGGAVTVQSAPGEGSTFTVDLPLCDDD
jgi:heavy metal sensor kinase